MKIALRKTISMITGEVLELVEVDYSGPIELACGASQGMKNIGTLSTSFYQNLMDKAGSVFDQSQGIFNDIKAAFEPIVAAGPNQKGFSPAEESARNSAAITNEGIAARNTQQAVRQGLAAAGGGNTALPSGVNVGTNMAVAQHFAENTASDLNNINQENYATGRNNFMAASGILSNAPNMFGTANSFSGTAIGAGNSAEGVQNDITQASQSWMQPVAGILGAGVAAAGGHFAKPGCWIAAAIYGGWEAPNTKLVRKYMYDVVDKNALGHLFVLAYEKFGERLAKMPKVVKALTPLFNWLLKRAKKLYGE